MKKLFYTKIIRSNLQAFFTIILIISTLVTGSPTAFVLAQEATDSATPTQNPISTPTVSLTTSPTTPTASASATPTQQPTSTPSPTATPTISPTLTPTTIPTLTDSPEAMESAKIKGPVKILPLVKHHYRANENITARVINIKDPNVKAVLLYTSGEEVSIPISKEVIGEETVLRISPGASFKPGKYTLKVTDSNGQESTQDFTWGVLAININKSIYLPNEKAKLSMAVLDEAGMMVCNAKLKLSIKENSQNINDELTTENGKIIVNPECQIHDFTTKPDYEADYQVGKVGIYEMELTAETKNGTYTINDSFEVKESVPFDVGRITATRIYPPRVYPVTFNITANQDFEGEIKEIVPKDFQIFPAVNNRSYDEIKEQREEKIIIWKVSLKKDESLTLGYKFDAPDISPQFYLLGPLKFKSEARNSSFDSRSGRPEPVEWAKFETNPNSLNPNNQNNIASQGASLEASLSAKIEASMSADLEATPSATPILIKTQNTVQEEIIFQEARQWQIAADLLAGDARATYTDSTVASPNQIRTRDYVRDNNLWQSEASTSQTSGATIKFVVDEASPTRNEHLVGIWEQSGSGTTLRILRWNGSSWSTEWTTTTANTTLGLYTRPFDIAYEKSSGDALVVYSTGAATTNELAFRVWNGTSWTAAANYDVAGTTALACGIEIESRPSSERIAMIYTVNAITASVNTAVWNGSGWESNPTTALESGALEPGTACQSKAYDIAWEESSGEILAAWGRNAVVQWAYSACTGAPCSWSTAALVGTEDGTALDLATQPGTNNIAISVLGNAGSDMGGGFWNGSSWSSTGTPDAGAANPGATLGQRSVGVGWLTSGATTKGILIYADATTAGAGVDYALVESGVVNLTETQCGTTPPTGVADVQTRVIQNPSDASKFLVLIEDANSDLWAVRFTFDGTTVTCADTNGGVALNANLTSATSQPFDFAFDLPRLPVFPSGLIQFDATHQTVISTGGSTTDGVTTNLYLDSDAGGNTLSESFTPKVEVRDIGTSFSNTVTNTGDSVQYDAEKPPDVRGNCIIYDSLNQQLVSWGGYMGGATKAVTNDTWVLPLKEKQRPQWKKLTTTGTRPQANRAHVCVYDSAGDRLVVYGGYDGTSYLTTPWALTLPSSGTPTWSQLTAVAGPNSGQQLEAVAVYDPTPSRMIVYGGYAGTTAITTVYQLTLSGTPTWSDLNLTTGPSATGQGRDDAAVVYDEDSDRMVMYGGYLNRTADTNSVWSLNLVAGSEAWTQITPTGDAGARDGHMAAFQPDYSGTDDRMIIYAGWRNGPYDSDVWELTLPESGGSVWTDKTPSTGKPQPVAYGSPSGVYDPLAKQALFFGGYDGTNYTNDVIAFDLPASGAFEYKHIDTTLYFRPRDASSAAYDSTNNAIITFGGAGRGIPTDVSGGYSYHLNETWRINTTGTPIWRKVGTGLAPIVRELASVIFDPLNNRFIASFGLSTNTVLNDSWAFSTGTTSINKWTNLNPSGTPPTARWGAPAIYDSANDRMVIFGGLDGPTWASGTLLNDVKVLNLPSGSAASWSAPTVSGGPPSARWQASAIYDPNRQRMIMFGGATATTTMLNDVWELTLPSSGSFVWTQLSPTGATLPAVRRGTVAVFDPDRGDGTARMVIFGGYDGTNHYNDVWELTLPTSGDGAWTQLSPSGANPWARRSTGGGYDSVNDRMIIFGGRQADQFFGDTWSLTLGSSPAWTNLDPQVMVPVSVGVTGLTSGTSYHWQSWVTSSLGDSTKIAYGGNSDTPPAGIDFIISGGAAGPTLDQLLRHGGWFNSSGVKQPFTF